MGQGERGDTGPKGDTGNPGVGIQFVTWNSTTGEMLITKTDGTVNPPLKIQGIQGPMGPAGNYNDDQLANAVITKGGGTFINSLGTNLANKGELATNIADKLSSDAYVVFRNKISSNLINSANFQRSISSTLSTDPDFKEFVTTGLGDIITTGIAPVVSPKTIWCGTDNNCALPTTGTLNIPTGYNSSGVGGQPIVFSQKPSSENLAGGYRHFITTRHENKDGSNNAFDFYVNSDANATTSSAPGIGNKKVMSIGGAGIDAIGATPNTPGYINFRKPDGTRAGYIGFKDNTNTKLVLHSESGYTGWQINGDLNAGNTVTSGLQVGDGGKLKISGGSSDYTVLGTKDGISDTNNTRIVISGRDRGSFNGNIEYLATHTGQHLWFTGSDVNPKMSLDHVGNLNIKTGGMGSIQGPDGNLRINRHGIIFGGANDNTRELNSAQISAGIHEANKLNIVGMSTGNDTQNRKIKAWAEGGFEISGPLIVNGRNILDELDNSVRKNTDYTLQGPNGHYCYQAGGDVWCDQNWGGKGGTHFKFI